ncbi:MAG: RsmD family RNA methyltransferase [Chloroflexi bacterium]|nr:RsmD family RNA methyltransferase [Chloroflexota bacterium]
MRVIAGAAKGHRLKTPVGLSTRPTSDKIKGVIFSMVESLWWEEASASPEGASMVTSGDAFLVYQGKRVLDLCAGTGALGIEALSRGADWTDFVESSIKCCRLIGENLERTHLQERGQVYHCDVERAMEGIVPGGEAIESGYDLVLFDPPYTDPRISETLEAIARAQWVRPGTLLVVEHSKRVTLAEGYGGLRIARTRRHGDTCITIYRWHKEAGRVANSGVG